MSSGQKACAEDKQAEEWRRRVQQLNSAVEDGPRSVSNHGKDHTDIGCSFKRAEIRTERGR